MHAVTGAVLGLVIALGALASRAIAANVFATAGWLWALAIVAVVDGFLASRGLGTAQLGVWRFTDGGPMWRDYYVPGALLMLGAALLIGGLAAFPAANRGDGRIGVAISGAVGPLIVAVAYVLTAPSSNNAPVEQISAYLTAPYTVLAGLAGSILVAAVGVIPGRRRTSTRTSTRSAAETGTTTTVALEPAVDQDYPGGLAPAIVSAKGERTRLVPSYPRRAGGRARRSAGKVHIAQIGQVCTGSLVRMCSAYRSSISRRAVGRSRPSSSSRATVSDLPARRRCAP